MLQTSYRSQVFLGVHFVLFGFDPITENKVRFKIVNGGGVDVGQYSRSCTHVIVDKLEYDDPVCVAAQNDGKTLVTALWVDHSVDVGMPVDASSVMYRPLKNLNGIPGAKSLIVCLTGYQRQDRDDIMTMVGLMGAQFSKPLVANKITHLICYKFEGEKYELAKKLPTIRLVNHRWLEDCLKEWVLLPEDNYNKSGYELEMMEAEAKDSEDEAEGSMLGQYGGRNINRSPLGSKIGLAMTHELSNSMIETSNACPDSTAPQDLVKVNKGEDPSSVPGNGYRFDQVSQFNSVNNLKISSEDPDVVRKDALVQLPETCVKAPEHSNNDVTNAFGRQDLGAPADANPSGSGLLPDMHYGTSEVRESVNDLRPTSESAKRAAHSNAKASAVSDYRTNTRGFTPPKNMDESSGKVTGPSGSRLDDLKFGSNPETASSKMEKGKGSISSPCVKASGKGCDFINGEESISLLPQKRITEASCTPLKSRKVTPNAKSSVDRTPPANDKVQGMKSASLINEPHENEQFSVSKDGVNDSNTSSISKSAAFTSNSLPFNVPFLKIVGSESVQGDNAYQKLAKASVKSSSVSNINGKPEITSTCVGQATHDGNAANAAQPQNVQEDLGNSAPSNKRSQNEESTGLGNLNLCNKVSNNSVRKSPRKKTIAKKSLGARPKLNAAAKQKASVSSKRASPKVGVANYSSSCKDPATCDAEKLQTSPQITIVETSLEQENVNKFAEDASNRTELLDDETEAPEDELGMALDENKSDLVNLSKKADTKTEEKSEAINQITRCEEEMPPKKGQNQSKQQEAVSRTKPELLDLSSKAKENHKRKKCPAGRYKINTAVAMDIGVIKIHSEREDDARVGTPEQVSLPAGRNDTSTLPANNSDSFSEEKENIPIDGEQDIREGGSGGNSGIKSSVGSAKINQKVTKTSDNSSVQENNNQRVSKTSDNSSVPENNRRVKSEAVCFIVSGHRLQRKEFQQVIRRLKGRVCRDSHQWSYQATRFIAPDPVRRTEKFFAAAASGRWILKTDYLTACSQAGKFLAEEPYEWHKSGLSEDGAISMEAPRKWRLLKERTGHGALYGMRVIIYGDCIAPPLDTLKRVIKAGDGTLLATSPPYTRFLDKGIDYAIVSPGMPRVDVWVQEFLKHEIPCVVADYLVEYVCKPGFSLQRHVLYGTQAWAEKSFAKLRSRAEEITVELAPPEKSVDNDIMCQVCGSRDRGEVMLICGDESGSVGCGIGSHIDCCDPPLDSVPQEDWFCPKCRTRNCSNPAKKNKNRLLSSSKRK